MGNDPARQQLIDGLNEDLAAEYQAVITYLTFSKLANGPLRPQLAAFFESEIADELGHAQLLAHKIIALGGVPVTEPARVTLSHDNREMLQIVLQAEKETIDRYTQRIKQAEAAGELGLKVDLEDLVSDETGHKEDIERMLFGWNA
jgi:bacterioferritin